MRGHFRGKEAITAFLLSPIMLPGIVIGIAILIFYSAFGYSQSIPLVILSHVVFTLPFVIRSYDGSMERTNLTLEEAAENLGANTWQIFRFCLASSAMAGNRRRRRVRLSELVR